METLNSDAANLDSASPSVASNGVGGARSFQLASIRFLQSPISSLLEYAGVLRAQLDSAHSAQRSSSSPSASSPNGDDIVGSGNSDSGDSSNNGEVSIRIIEERDRVGDANDGVGLGAVGPASGTEEVNGNGNESGNNRDGNDGESSPPHQRYDIQQAARWIEQILPFSLLLLVVFIRQHFQGFVVILFSTAVLFKSNDFLRKQTALKGERKIIVLVGYMAVFILHIFGIYLWHRKDDILYLLLMIPPRTIPPFWHAVFLILINDIMVRQAAMIFKLVLLMYYKNGRGHNFRRQGQMLTLVEYALLLYRALLPTPVWYRYFLNKKYGSLFSSLTTGLYLTFKLTSIVDKVRSFFAAIKALSRKEVHYGSHATTEQVNAAGDLCAICQEKIQTPILLRCKHIFCEDCVSEWFERERTCPLCRALVRPADLQSYGDGSTSLFFQVF